MARRIEPINVHTARSLPPQLDGVPAILYGGQLLVGPDTFKWVQMTTASEQNRNRDRDREDQNGGMPMPPGMRRPGQGGPGQGGPGGPGGQKK